MENTGVQNSQLQLFSRIREALPSQYSLAEVIAGVLNISTDSAYRRIRGDKVISFDEAKTICRHFHISLDQFLFEDSGSVLFSGGIAARIQTPSLESFLQGTLTQLRYINSFDHREMFILPKDIPMFYFFYFKELAAFKLFFWMKTFLQYPLYAETLFTMEHYTPSMQQTAAKINEEYNQLPVQEIWNKDILRTTLRQIEYYKDAKMFHSPEEIIVIYDCLEKLINHLECQAECGRKFLIRDGQQAEGGARLHLYLNEYVLGDNTVLAILNKTFKVVYLNHSILNFIITSDPGFADHHYQCIQNYIRKSTLVSTIGEKERGDFFYDMRKKIQARREAAADYRPLLKNPRLDNSR